MTDELSAKIAQIEALRAVIGNAAADAAIAALQQPPPAPPADIAQTVSGAGAVGVAGSVSHSPITTGSGNTVLAPLFPAGGSGNYFADVIHVTYGQHPQAQQDDYGAALRRYLEHLYTRHATIDLRGIDDRPMDMPLSELYVSLSLHEPPPDDLRGRWGLRGFIEKARRWIGTSEAEEDDHKEQGILIRAESGGGQAVDWSQALRHPRIAVIGTPGSGKTTLLQFTAVRLAEILARDDDTLLTDLGLAAETRKPPVPLLLPLREFGAYLDGCSKARAMGAGPRLLLECFASYYRRFDLNLPPDFFSQVCEAGRALVLLDGLDEVTRSEDRVFVSSVVREFVLRYDQCRYVVTSRVAAYHGDARIEAGFRICTVADLSADQQQRFIQNWSRSLHRLVYGMQEEQLQREAGRYADDLWQALQPNQRVRELARNPLLLTVVAVIFWNKYQLPEDRASLYEECVEVLLRGGRGKSDRPSQERARLAMGLNQRREVLAAVAYAMHQQGQERLSVSRSELLRMVASHLRQRGDGEAAAQTFVEELPVHIGLLDEREPDRYRFSHLSFQEFLAARHVAETDAWGNLLAYYQESWWREVILLCVGHLSSERCWRFLGELLNRGQRGGVETHSAALALAADALGELEKFKGQGPLKERIAAEALSLLDLPAP
ncbi:MAG: hypothetical protein HC884_19765, partial [Chloroflexaceae bacterium]|nr:hypothetical protein [Chloroflexaceae bacterium]